MSFTEEIPIADAPFSLIYISERYSDRIRKGLDPDISKSFVGGWWLSIHSYYSWKTNTIYYGNGDKQVLNFSPKAESDGSVLLLNPSASNYSQYDSDGDLRYTKSAYSHKKLLNVSYKGDYVDITDAYGKVWRTDYTKGEIISPNGVKTIFVKNDLGKLVLVRLPNGATYEMTYDLNYRLATFKKPLGKITTFVYDKEGNLQKDIRSDGRHIEITSTSEDKIMNAYATTNSGFQRRYEIASANYGTHRNVHTEYGAMSSVLNRTAEKDTHVWDIYGGKTEMVHADDPRWGVESKYLRSYSFKAGSINITRKQTSTYNNGILQYNIVHQNDAKKTYRFLVHMKPDEVLTGIQTPEARFATRTYNNFGDILNSSSGSITQSYSYDQKGRLIQVTAGGKNTKFEYGANGDLNKVIDPLGLQYLFEYDSVKRVSKATYPNGSFVSFNYDLEGNLTGIKPPSKPTHTFSFNQNGLPVTYLAPLVATAGDTSTEIRYDSDDRVSQIIQGGKTAVAYKFGVNDSRLVKVEHSHGSTDISYAVNPDKKPTDLVGSLQTSDGVRTSYSYIWKLPEVVWTQGEVIHTLKYKYNPDASLAAIEVAGKDGKLFSTGFKYDLDGLLVGAGSLKYVLDKSGRIESSAFGVITTKTQYNDYQVTAETVTANKKNILVTNLNRDALGRIVTENSNGTATTYEYDTNGRLVRATQNGVVRAYEYDENGNRIAFKSGNTVINGQYDEQDRLLSYGRFKFSYSDAGHLVKKEEFQGPASAPLVTTYDYDTLGNLRKVVLPDGRIIEYVIDGQNRRIGKKINGQLVQGFIYQTQYQIAAETDGAGNIIRRFVYGSKINIPDYVVTGGKEYRVISNQVGTPKAIVESSTGKIVETLSYDEFGVSLDGKRSSYLPFGFAGGLNDGDTDLLRFGARDYDPEIGRWTSKDPILFAGGDTNLYGYVIQDPVNLTDPTENCPWCIGAAIGAISSGATAYIVGGSARDIVVAAATGAIAGAASMGVSAFTSSATGIILSNAAIGSIANVATQVGTGTSLNQVNLVSAAIGGIAGGIGGAASLAAGNMAFFNTRVIGNPLGVAFARSREFWASTSTGAAIGTGVESGANMCR
ncbi:RHS repeat domain-containing protein [Bdellovibrio bacteriovorus]|uniref:RHS repeat domain-containing protein n=1 Tax=Bdellovibrio bacteriovorus TaxID=959 RepID=UPI0035A59562